MFVYLWSEEKATRRDTGGGRVYLLGIRQVKETRSPEAPSISQAFPTILIDFSEIIFENK